MYTTSVLEDWIIKRYIRSGIRTPADIDINRIAKIHGIGIHQKEIPARFDIYGRYRSIVLDSRCTVTEQREQFFHELCHILRHVGHQSMMPAAFRQLQEWDAIRFTMYAAIPMFMLEKYDFESPYLIQDLAEDFKITEELCFKRIEHIKRNALFVAETKVTYI